MGSEMCIRDRIKTKHTYKNKQNVQKKFFKPSPEHPLNSLVFTPPFVFSFSSAPNRCGCPRFQPCRPTPLQLTAGRCMYPIHHRQHENLLKFGNKPCIKIMQAYIYYLKLWCMTLTCCGSFHFLRIPRGWGLGMMCGVSLLQS